MGVILEYLVPILLVIGAFHYTGLLGETVRAGKFIWKKILDKITPPEQRALMKKQEDKEQMHRDLAALEARMDEIGGKLDTATNRATTAKELFEEKKRKVVRVKTSGNQRALIQAVDEATAAKNAWVSAVAAAERIKGTYEQIQGEHAGLMADVLKADAGVTRAEVDVLETTATRLGNDVRDRARKLRAAAGQPVPEDEVISDELGRQRRRAERLAGNESDRILAEADKADDRESMAKELGIDLADIGVAPASGSSEPAALPPPSDVPMPIIPVDDKAKAPVEVKRGDKKD